MSSIRVLFVSLLVVACSNHNRPDVTATSQSSVSELLLPGDGRLSASVQHVASTYEFFVRRAPDSTERSAAHVARDEVANGRNRLLLTTRWTGSFNTRDSMIVDTQSLAPISEALFSGNRWTWFDYDGSHVVARRLGAQDGGVKVLDTTFSVPVFAFSEVELLVRSLAYRNGLHVIVPLFSEGDLALERDTIAVVGRAGDSADAPWIVRFADPVIMSSYRVDPRSRVILETITHFRKSPGSYRYALSTP